MAIHVPTLASAVTELADRGHVELFYGPAEGEVGLAVSADVPRIVSDPASWWNEQSVPQTVLVLTPVACLAPIPERRPDLYGCVPE
jgi:hypothetical protein